MNPDEWRTAVGTRVARRREDLRLSVRAAARRAGISEGMWRQIESGRRVVVKGVEQTVNPRPGTRAVIAGALGWSADSIDRLVDGLEPVVENGALEVSGDGTVLEAVASATEAVTTGLARIDGRLDAMQEQLDELVARVGPPHHGTP